jgi:hypothetical protein
MLLSSQEMNKRMRLQHPSRGNEVVSWAEAQIRNRPCKKPQFFGLWVHAPIRASTRDAYEIPLDRHVLTLDSIRFR